MAAYLSAHPGDTPHRGSDATAANGTATLPGNLVFGKYQVVKVIGEGGMGEVFLARHAGPGDFEKLVVLKRVRSDRLSDNDAVQEFFREARIAARVSHRNIVQIFDFGQSDSEYFIAMEYVRGIDLASALWFSRDIHMEWPIGLCCRIISDLCAGLHAAHSYRDEAGKPVPIIHRDVSPGNVLVAEDGTVKLADFGVATAGDITSDTEPGVFKGKCRYASPERLLGRSAPLDPRIDIYAAGALLFECLTLRNFTPPDHRLALGLTIPVPSAKTFRQGVSDELDAVMKKALHADPDGRFQSAREFQDRLEAILKASGYATAEDLSLWVRNLISLRARATSDGAVNHDGSPDAAATVNSKWKAQEQHN